MGFAPRCSARRTNTAELSRREGIEVKSSPSISGATQHIMPFGYHGKAGTLNRKLQSPRDTSRIVGSYSLTFRICPPGQRLSAPLVPLEPFAIRLKKRRIANQAIRIEPYTHLILNVFNDLQWKGKNTLLFIQNDLALRKPAIVAACRLAKPISRYIIRRW